VGEGDGEGRGEGGEEVITVSEVHITGQGRRIKILIDRGSELGVYYLSHAAFLELRKVMNDFKCPAPMPGKEIA
jgi:hypothetical protein